MFEKFIEKTKTKKPAPMKDLSFGNLFWKRAIICLCISLPICIALYSFTSGITMQYTQAEVERNLNETLLGITEYLSSDMYEDNAAVASSIDLSTMKEEVESIPCVSKASISLYNLTERKIMAKSYETMRIDSDEAYQWWSKMSGYKNGQPKISIDAELLEFCQSHRDSNLVINKMIIMNSVLFPFDMSAFDDSGKLIDSCVVFVQSVDSKYHYEVPTNVSLVGNTSEDDLYELMSDYTVVKNPETKITEVSYAKDIPSNVFQKTLLINIGGVEYQADCLYTASFWTGYTAHIIIAELICLLLCAGIALVSSKFTSDIYNK